MTNARKLLARLEPQSKSAAPARRRSHTVGTATDARRHAPPDSAEWRRRVRVIELLRHHVWGNAGRTHAPSGTRSLKDPDATENIDVAGALAIAANGSSMRALAVNVYLYRNWPHFAERSKHAMAYLATTWLIGKIAVDVDRPWVKRLIKLGRDKSDALIERMVAAALEELVKPNHCSTCHGHGVPQAGRYAGLSCPRCDGNGVRHWSNNARARRLRVRRRDWDTTWCTPHLALLDLLVDLDGKGAAAHAQAMVAP